MPGSKKAEKRLKARRDSHNTIPANVKQGHNKPGSQNRNK